MPIDVYTVCPGGTGKSIKFCCKDLVGELNQIDGMIRGDQYQAALAKIDQLLTAKPDRACLLELKCQLLSATGQEQALPAVVQRYVEKYPGNPVALAERAMLTAEQEGGGVAAMAVLQESLGACQEGFSHRVYQAIGVVAEALLADGQFVSARALFYLQTVIDREDRHPVEAIMQLNASLQVPLLLKDDPMLQPPPDDAPWSGQYRPVIEQAGRGRWAKAAEVLDQITASVPDVPLLWHNLAVLRSWLADNEAAAAALQKLATLDLPLEEAVEAQTTALLMVPDGLGDEIEVIGVTYPVDDVDAAQAALAGADQVSMMPIDPAAVRDQGPPPRAVCFFLDRPKLPNDATGFADESVPRMLAQGLLYGRETDRPARIEIPAISVERWEAVRALLAGIVPGVAAEAIQAHPVGRISRSRELLRRDWALPRGPVEAQSVALVDRLHRALILSQWPESPLGLLGGKTPREAAADPAQRVKLLAAILLLETWSEVQQTTFDFNDLRQRLGLPILGPIDPTSVTFSELPLISLHRLEAAKLSDESLLFAFRRAVAYQVTRALDKLAGEVVSRSGLTAPLEKARAYQHLAEHAQDFAQALEYIEHGRQASLAAGRSCASWDFMELPLHLESNNVERFGQLINHLQTRHIEEPGVAQSLMQFLVRIGALNPDGTPAVPPGAQPDEPLLSPAAAAEPSKLWTPGSAGGTPGTGGKLWTPD